MNQLGFWMVMGYGCMAIALILGWLELRDRNKAEKRRIQNKLVELEMELEDDRISARADMDILSKRITNAFDYIYIVEKSHLAQFHPIHLPKWNAHTKKGKE